MTMSRAGPPLMAGWLVLSAIVAASAEEAKDTDNALSPLATALTQGRPSLDLRYRFEHVDQKGFSRDARANTVRARFGYETGAIHGFYLFFEGDGVAEIGGETFNDTVNGRAQFPVIADESDPISLDTELA